MASHRTDKSSAAGQEEGLSQKDTAAFKNMMDLYNQKHYKKGLKIADALVAKYPKHGEVLSFRALLLANVDPSKQDEALELAREGLRYDLRSYLCWYVLGVVYKQRKLKKDALKCFTMALKVDPKNDRLMKDICALAIEVNDYAAFRKYASQALQIRVKHFKEWMAFAFAQHMCGNIEAACKVVAEAELIFSGNYCAEPFEVSSAMLYWAMILEESERYEECIKVLTAKEPVILDNIMRLDYLVKAAIGAKQWDLAHETCRALVQINPDNARYTVLFIVTHKAVRNRGIFQMPLPHATAHRASNRGGKSAGSADATEVPGESEFLDKVLRGVLPPIVLSEEIMDIDGEYSTSNWCGENMINRTFDRYVSAMRQKAESAVDATRDEKLFLGCYSYADYLARVSKAFDVTDLPDPDVVEIDEVGKLLDEYLREYPVARNCLYSTRSKVQPWSRHPLFLFSRELTKEESCILLEALSEVKTNNYLGRALTASFTVDDHTRQLHKIVESLIEVGCISVFKYFVHGCTFGMAYRLMVLFAKYEQNLSRGFPLGHGIGEPQSRPGGAARSEAEHRVVSQNYLVVVQLVAARIYDYVGRFQEALQVLGRAVATTPTAVDAHLLIGKVYRHLGAFEKSKEAFCMAADVDRSDRQTSCKAAKALLRASRFEASREKWRRFLVEDTTKPEERGDKGKPAPDAPPEVKSMKYELMAAEQYRCLYILGTTGGGGVDAEAADPGEWLKEAHDIYADILEKRHQVYLDQLEYHNYCLNRLQYQTYYHFNRIRASYATQFYFVRAAEGILWTTAELRRRGIPHSTVCSRTLEEVTKEPNLDYCIDLIKVVSSQRLYHAGLYAAIHKFAALVDLPLLYEVQCAVRTYHACHKNPAHPDLYPAIFKIIRNSQYRRFVGPLSQVFPKWGKVAFDEQQQVFRGADKSVLTDVEASELYLDGIISQLHALGVWDWRHCEAVLRCAYELADQPGQLLARIDDSYVGSIGTFSELRDHYLFLRTLVGQVGGGAGSSVVRGVLDAVGRTLRDKYPESDFDVK
ncbi:tetratricopeptide repeat-containing protein [Babesia caballi]|uniref:Tetratricopeptide repeat-containing protein n=1 Tax=Babesia caballi TaxID=5871 RepID=A0AAV4LRF6_BABCB|nr:tetratricopeptide repeat-containing protein [Babesia caballi]